MSNENDETENEMNCKCSRKVWELEKERSDVTLHCQTNGNFEKLQCDQGRCWCVEPRLGHVTTIVVHEDLAQFLYCFSRKTFGSQYLRTVVYVLQNY